MREHEMNHQRVGADLPATEDLSQDHASRSVSADDGDDSPWRQTGTESPRLVGNSPAIRAVLSDLQAVSAARCPVLLEGESGTGKEFVARSIHQLSCRTRAPFEAVNCSAIPETLMESELFGHVTGAFTGAIRPHKGVFERARDGTVFLDEIAEMSPAAQAKLLRVLQEKNFIPVGGETLRTTHARIIAATNRDLKKEVSKGGFREDLYYRLSVFPIRLPPLRERREDIPLLIEHFLNSYALELGVPRIRIQPDALRRLLVYSYPGNVRELQNIISALLIEARRAREISDRHVAAVFSRHRLHEPMPSPDGAKAEADATDDDPPQVGAWVLDQLRLYRFNIALAERMLILRRRDSRDPRSVPVCSRSGLTYYLQGEGFRALAAKHWNVDAAALDLARDNLLVPRVRDKLHRYLASARDALEQGGDNPGPRLIALRKAFSKLPETYQQDVLRLAERLEQGS